MNEELSEMEFRYHNDAINKISKIQQISLDIYGKYDLEKSLLWMTEEFGEFFKSIRKKESKDNIAGEMGDLLAWIFCIGNILDIDVSDAIISTFKKEISRQLKVYERMKYCDKLEGLEIVEQI